MLFKPPDSGTLCWLFGFGFFVFLAVCLSFPEQGEAHFAGNVRV
jgi:hypothetical protein